MALTIGIILNNRYRIVSILGQGGMGSVYRAMDENLGIAVAVKENLFLSDEYARQFQREASILASLRHPNLPRVGDYFILPGQGQYLIMDFIDGEDLRQRIERVSTLPEKEVILMGTFICDALSYLHTRKPPVVHRDLKPGNIKITPEGQVYLVDFGLAKVMVGSQATTTGARAMTPGYSPPEQYGTARTDPRSDIYSLGATLYAALTGTIPEDGLARLTGKAELTPIRSLQPKFNRRLASVLEKALAVEPEDRYQNAEDFRQDLLAAGDLTGSLGNLGFNRITVTPPPPPSEDPDTSEPISEELGESEIEFPTGRRSQPLMARNGRKSVKRKKQIQSVFRTLILALLIGLPLAYFFIPGAAAVPPALLSAFLPTTTPLPATATIAPTIAIPNNPEITATTSASAEPALPPTQPAEKPTSLPALQPTNTPTPIQATATLRPEPASTPIGGGYGEMAFVSERTGIMQIWTMDSNGENLRQITNHKDGACQPSWSPDGSQIAFIAPCLIKKDQYPNVQIYLMNADGSNIHPLPVPADPSGDYDPAWSPDGNRIAFTSLRAGKPHVFVYSFKTKKLEEISDSRHSDKNPTWAPLGTELIAFVREQVTSQVWIAPTDGRSPVQFTRSGDVLNAWPTWSNDGSIILFSQFTYTSTIPILAGKRYDDRDNLHEFRIFPKNSMGAQLPVSKPSISPDMNWVVFESWPDGRNHDVYLMRINGADVRRLTADPDFDFSPVWRPTPAK